MNTTTTGSALAATTLEAVNLTRQTVVARRLRLALTTAARGVGLLADSPASFGEGDGLWIEPCKGVHTMGMRFPIDAIYLDAAHRVIHIASDLRPWRLAAIRRHAAGVLELPAGMAARTGTELGDVLDLGGQA